MAKPRILLETIKGDEIDAIVWDKGDDGLYHVSYRDHETGAFFPSVHGYPTLELARSMTAIRLFGDGSPVSVPV